MGRAPCCDKANVKKGPWSPEEDSKLKDYIEKHGTGGNWISLPQKAGLKRCGKSCRLRWLNYLRPNIKHGEFSEEEDRIICSLFASIGSRWSIIAAQLPGRTDNDIKNYWNTKLKKKLMALTSSSSQRKPLPYPSSHQAPVLFPSSPPSQSLSSLYRDYTSFYTNSTKPFAGFDSIVNSSSIPCSLMMNNTTTSLATGNPSLILQNQEMSLLSPMQYYPMRDNLLMFGSEASCSSSDGSCSQISYGREIKQEDMGFQSFVSNGQEDQSQKFMLSYAASSADNHDARNQWAEEKPNGYYGGNPLDYGLEEVKQLISSSSSNNNNNSLCSNSHNNFFNIDENKTQEKMMYFYNY